MGKDIGVVVARGLNVPNFLKDISRTPKSILRWGTISNLLWSPKEYMNPEKGDRCLNSLGMDVPIVVNDVPKVSTFVPRWGKTFNHLLWVPKGIYHDKGDRGPHSPRNGCTYFSHIRNLNSLD